MRGYRDPAQTAADCLRHAERCERQGKPKTADDYRAVAAEQPALALRISAVLSVETGEGT
jgi:hypothetical protein